MTLLPEAVQSVSYQSRPVLQELVRDVGTFIQDHIFLIVGVFVGLAILVMYLRE